MDTKAFITNVSALEDGQLFDRFYRAMDKERRDKIDACIFPRDKRLSLGVGTLLKWAQREYGQGLKYNLSHSGEIAMCAISGHEIGCDVEKHRDRIADIADRFFYRSEYETIMSQGDEASQNKMFFRFWTLKESFMKVTKLGFKLPLNDFEIIIKDDKITVAQRVDNSQYSFYEYDFDPAYGCAVAVKDYNGKRPELIKIDLREINL